jgi:hypothetical protein
MDGEVVEVCFTAILHCGERLRWDVWIRFRTLCWQLEMDRMVAISGDGMRKWTAGSGQKIEKGSVDWRVSFVNYTSYACCHRLLCDKKAQLFHSLEQNRTLTYSSFVSRNVRLLSQLRIQVSAICAAICTIAHLANIS